MLFELSSLTSSHGNSVNKVRAISSALIGGWESNNMKPDLVNAESWVYKMVAAVGSN